MIPGLNILVGNNAQGKTNILESIFFSCTGKSHRTSKDKELIRINEQECFILTELQREEGKSIIAVSYTHLQADSYVSDQGID